MGIFGHISIHGVSGSLCLQQRSSSRVLLTVGHRQRNLVLHGAVR